MRYTIVIIFNEELDKVVLINKKRKILAGKLNLPGGKIEDNESVVNCAIREIMEETGLIITDVTHFLTVKQEEIQNKQDKLELNVLYAINTDGFKQVTNVTDEKWNVYSLTAKDLNFYNPVLGKSGDVALYINFALELIKRK